ncbi:MAG: N-acetylmuramoyl-L-alanine amidase, partial [Bacteroidota bacterium]|nr:N-acetylmuramoyl-L-alanine amidase [Bacteroidota bacterium]
MTRILIETGFISNKVEGAYLNSEAGQNQMARAIANAILSYKKEYFGNGGDENNAIAKTLPADSSVPQPSKEVLSSTKIPTNPVKKVEDAPVVSQTPVVTEVAKPVVVAPNPVPVPVAVPEKKPSNTDDSSKLVYKIQFFATNKKRELIPSNFNGLEGVMEEIEGEFYKYSCGLTQDYNESKLTLSKVQQNGYPSAFLIIFKDGRKFSSKEVNEVLEIENNKAMNAQVVLATKAPIEIKKDSVKEKNVDTIPAPEKQVANEEEKIIYKVQILASKTLKDSQVFDSQGLKDVAVSYENSFYKYLYGATTDYNTSMVYLEEARSKGYNSAFLIAFKEGKKVAVEEPKK